MTDFEQILEECLDDLQQGASNVDECLARHPRHALQLRPILLTAERLEEGRAIRPSAVFKARARAKLTQHMHAHPRKGALFNFTLMQLAASLAIIVLALLATGTTYAQSALPGDSLYQWKLASERVWRAVSPHPFETDIAIANRRIEEMNALADDPIRKALALEGYQEVLTRLEAELDAETLKQILPVIEVEQQSIEDSVQPITTPLPGVTVTPQPASTDALLPTLPNIPPTSIPKVIPTIQIPPSIPKIIPTIQIPLPVP